MILIFELCLHLTVFTVFLNILLEPKKYRIYIFMITKINKIKNRLRSVQFSRSAMEWVYRLWVFYCTKWSSWCTMVSSLIAFAFFINYINYIFFSSQVRKSNFHSYWNVWGNRHRWRNCRDYWWGCRRTAT